MRTLPDPLRRVFEANAAYLSEQAITPDLQRAGPSDPDHFLDMDAFGGAYPFETISRVESENIARLGKDITAKGRLPWKIDEVYRALVQAFRDRDTPRVLAAKRRPCQPSDRGRARAPARHRQLRRPAQRPDAASIPAAGNPTSSSATARSSEAEVEPAAAQRIADPVDCTFAVLRESYLHSLQVLALGPRVRHRPGPGGDPGGRPLRRRSTSRASMRAEGLARRAPGSAPPPPPPASLWL